MNFLGRKYELREFGKYLNAGSNKILAIHGRLRLGKTSLVLQALKNSQIFYFPFPLLVSKDLLELFSERINDFLEFKDTKQFTSWQEALELLFKIASIQDIPIVFDNYENLLKSEKSITKHINSLFNLFESKLKIVLIANTVSDEVFRDELLTNPKVVRFEIKPMSFVETSLFYPDKSFEERLRLFAVFGGIPAYATLASKYSSAFEALQNLVFSAGAPLNTEIDYLFNTELREPTRYYSILHSLRGDLLTPHEIATRSKFVSSGVQKYLDKLLKMKIIKKISNIADISVSRNIVYYATSDCFIKNWFSYILPNYYFIETGMYEGFFKKANPLFQRFVCDAYVIAATQALAENVFSWLSFVPTKIGVFKSQISKIDLVAESEQEKKVAFFSFNISNKVDFSHEMAILKAVTSNIGKYFEYAHFHYLISQTKTFEKGSIFFGD